MARVQSSAALATGKHECIIRTTIGDSGHERTRWLGVTLFASLRVSRQVTKNLLKLPYVTSVAQHAEETYILAVANTASANQLKITSTPPDHAVVGINYDCLMEGFNPDNANDTLAWSLDQAPAGMEINPDTGVIAWNPSSYQAGAQPLTVRLTDSQGTSVARTFSIEVSGAGGAPVVQTTAIPEAQKGVAYSVPILAFDPNGLPLTYTMTSSPTASGLSINYHTGVLTWSNPDDAQSPYTLDVIVSDGLQSVPVSYSLYVASQAVNQPPSQQRNGPSLLPRKPCRLSGAGIETHSGADTAGRVSLLKGTNTPDARANVPDPETCRK